MAVSVAALDGVPKPDGVLIQLPTEEGRLSVTDCIEIDEARVEILQDAAECFELLERGMKRFNELQLVPGEGFDLLADFVEGIPVPLGELVHRLIELFVRLEDRTMQPLKLLDEGTNARQERVRLVNCENLGRLLGRQLSYTLKEEPHPQDFLANGLLNSNPPPTRPLLKSIVVPSR